MTFSDRSTALVTATSTPSTYTLGAELEHDRLESRVSRMRLAVGVLRQRERENRRGPGAPHRHLGQVIADFEAQIDAMNARLRDLGIDRPSIQIQRQADGCRY
jgi:hypothetical protein